MLILLMRQTVLMTSVLPLASDGAVVSDVSQKEGARNTTVIYLDFYIFRRAFYV